MEYDVNPQGSFVPPPNEQNGYNYNQPVAQNADQILINAYIGSNASAIYSSIDDKPKYNWAAALLGFFFGPVWFFYRKIYLIGFGLFFLTILFRVASSLSHSIIVSILVWGCNLALAALYLFFANSIYINNVKKKVNKIKEQNPQKSIEELAQIASYKGNVSIPAAIIYAFVLLIAIVISVVIAVVGLFKSTGTDVSKMDQLKIYDGIGAVYFKKGMLNTFSETPNQGKPSSDILDTTSFQLTSPNDKAETMFVIYHTSDFKNISSVKQYLQASGLVTNIKSSINETSRTLNVLGQGSEEFTAVITSGTTQTYPTHKYILDASLGKYYSIVALTRIREADINSPEANEWLKYMRTAKVIDNNRTTWSTANIIGEPLYVHPEKVINRSELDSQNSSTNTKDTEYSSDSNQSQSSSSGTLKSEGTQIDISWPSGYKNTYSSDYIISLSKDSSKYEVKLGQTVYSTVDSYIKDDVMSSYDYMSKDKSYKNLKISEPSTIAGTDGREYKVIRINYTFDIGLGTGTDYEEVYAVTQVNKDNVYSIEITGDDASVQDSMLKDFMNIKVSNYSAN